MNNLMPQGYFDEVQKWMVREGFALISRVSIDTAECPYHVPCTEAQSTSMFFHLHGKSLMVMLRFDEDNCWDEDRFEGQWKIDVYIRFKNYGVLLDEHPEWCEQGLTENLFHDMPVLGSTRLQIEGFDYGNGSPCMERDIKNEQVALRFVERATRGWNEPINSRILVARIRTAVKMLVPYLDSKPFFRVSLAEFIPYYTFGGGDDNPSALGNLELTFWGKFDWNYFRNLVIKPYGYNYRKRS